MVQFDPMISHADRNAGMEHDPKLMARLNVKVVPGSSRDQIVGWLGDAVKIKVMAPPEKGKANEAVVALLAKALGLSVSEIQIESGHAFALKVVAIRGMDQESVNCKVVG